MKWGAAEIFELNTGNFRLDGGAMFGVVPKVLWQKKHVADEQNRIELALRCLLIKGPNYCALIDTGMGHKWDSRSVGIYGLKNTSLETMLPQVAGVTPAEITHVLITHLHFDHAGGLTAASEDPQQLRKVFTNAQVVVSEANLKTATQPYSRERASYRSENWQPYADSGQIQTLRISSHERVEVLPGLWADRSDGHTHGQLVYSLANEKSQRLVFAADLVPTSSHLSQNYGMGFDLQPLVLMCEKEKLLSEVCDGKGRLYFEHDPVVSAGDVESYREKSGGLTYRLLGDVKL